MYQLIRFFVFGLTILPDELIYVMSCYLCPNLVCRISMFAWSLISLSVSCGLRELGGAWTDVYITRCREPGRQDLEWQAEQKHFSRASFLALSLDQTHREGHKRGEAVVLPPTLNRHHPEKELSSMLATIDIDIVEQSWMGWAEFNGIVTWECFILHPWTPTFSNVGSFSWNQFYHVFSHFINSAPYSSSPAATQSTT